jgi:protein-disulfide isomerase-like protein with CxxC motif
MIKVDVGGKTEEQKAIVEKYGIDGFPTILIFKNGTPEPYEGKRSAEDFLNALS